MKLSALNEDQAAQRILEVVPPTFRAEVSRHLRMVQFANLMLGFDEGYNSCRREWALKNARTELDVGTPETVRYFETKEPIWNTFTDTEVQS